MSSSVHLVLLTTFLASAVEAIEMVTIVVGVGAARGWRSTLIGTVSGFLVLAAVIAVFGAALSLIPIGFLRLFVGTLLLIFGLQWFRKGIMRVAARGFAGISDAHLEGHPEVPATGMDWTAFVLAFKGVLLEGLEVAFIVVTIGANANQMSAAIVGGAGAIVLIGAIGLFTHRIVTRIPRSVLQLVVGLMLTTFGTFWAVEGLGVEWPASDGAILGLLIFYLLVGLAYITLERRRLLGLSPAT